MTGKVGSASSRNKRNLLVVDLWHVDRPIVFSRGLVFHVEPLPWSRVSSGFWVLLAHGHSSFIYIHALESGLQLLFPFCSIGDNHTALTPSILHIVFLFSMHCLITLISFLSARACLLCLSLSLLLGPVSSFVVSIPPPRWAFSRYRQHAHSPFSSLSISPLSRQLIQCFVIAHPLHSTIVSITTSSRLHI